MKQPSAFYTPRPTIDPQDTWLSPIAIYRDAALDSFCQWQWVTEASDHGQGLIQRDDKMDRMNSRVGLAVGRAPKRWRRTQRSSSWPGHDPSHPPRQTSSKPNKRNCVGSAPMPYLVPCRQMQPRAAYSLVLFLLDPSCAITIRVLQAYARTGMPGSARAGPDLSLFQRPEAPR